MEPEIIQSSKVISTAEKTAKIEQLISDAFRTNNTPAMNNVKRMVLKIIMPEFDKWVTEETLKRTTPETLQ